MLLAGLVLGLLPASAGAQTPIRPDAAVLILVSGDHSAYRRAEEGVRSSLRRASPATRLESVRFDAPEDEVAARDALAAGPSLVVGIGSRAVRFARERAPEIPLVYAMVLDPASLGLPVPGEIPSGLVTGVTMEVTPDRQFGLMHELLPGVRRVGVLYDPAVSGEAVRRAAVTARSTGLELVPQAVRSEGEVLRAARLLAPDVDALWALADPTVLTSANARALILLSLRSRRPLFAMSEGFVRSGALAALAADPGEVGSRAGELGLQVLRGEPPAQLRPEPPPRLAIYLNLATAEHLGLALPGAVVDRARAVYPQP
jgi:putative ABC transport system substrate-binding protein